MQGIGKKSSSGWKKGLRVGAALGACLFVASAASARDVCILPSGGSVLVLKGVPRLRPGKAVALKGWSPAAGSAAPVSGSATMDGSGAVQIGVFVHSLYLSGLNRTFEWTGDANFVGTGGGDSNGDYQSDGQRTFGAIDCKSVVIP